MKKQVVVIHGGGTFASHEAWMSYLKNATVDIDLEQGVGWKRNLPNLLGEEYEVILPTMPNKQNSQYEEWRIWFEHFIPFLKDGVIIVGHSLGAMFIAKYLSENEFPRKIKATFLIAAPFEGTKENNLLLFALPASLDTFKKRGGEIFLFHSKDDSVVPFSELEKYREALPDAHVVIFEDRGHFNLEQFPEIVEAIKGL